MPLLAQTESHPQEPWDKISGKTREEKAVWGTQDVTVSTCVLSSPQQADPSAAWELSGSFHPRTDKDEDTAGLHAQRPASIPLPRPGRAQLCSLPGRPSESSTDAQ